jgi:hypothetical protein
MKYIHILLILCLFLSTIHSIDVQMLSPDDKKYFDDNTIFFEYTYVADAKDPDFIHCSFLVDGDLKYAGDIQDGQTIQAESKDLGAGTHNWRLICDGYYSPTRTFTIFGQQSSITLLHPEDGYDTKEDSIRFNFLYSAGTHGPETAECSLYFDGSKKGSIQVPDSQDATIEFRGLALGEHEWYIDCGVASSISRRIKILAKDPMKLNLYSPADGLRTSEPNAKLEFEYMKNEDGPQTIRCMLSVDGQTVDSMLATSDVRSSFDIVLENQETSWQIICDPDSSSPLISKERVLILSTAAPKTDSEIKNNTENTTLVQSKDLLPIIFPLSMRPEQTLRLKLNSSKIDELKVILPDSTMLLLHIDEDGYASFTPPFEGEYIFMADGFQSINKSITTQNIATSYIPKILRPQQAPQGFMEFMLCASVAILLFIAVSIGIILMNKNAILKEDDKSDETIQIQKPKKMKR